MMPAEIIAVGTELTTGAKLDTNSQWLSSELAALGIRVWRHTTIADDQAAMVQAFRAAVAQSDLVLITGGLGPTLDDLTRQALAELAGVDLVLHEPSLAHIRDMFARRQRPMPQRNIIQAMFPAGSQPLGNPRGTAPGIWMDVARDGGVCHIAAMPGVPSEMTRMFRHEVLPRLPPGRNVIRRARVHCFGVGESHAEELLGDLTARGRDPDIGITVHEATITLRITAQAETAEACDLKVAAARESICARLGELVFGEEDDELEHVVVRMLRQAGFTLATAEGGTGGLLAQRLTDAVGFEHCYLGGVVAPTDAAQRGLLGLDRALLARDGPVSAEVAWATAAGCRQKFGSDFALAVTQWPQRDPDDAGGAPAAAYVALAGEGVREVQELVFFGDPAINKSRAAKTALNLLRLHLRNVRADSPRR